jgi:hypothetical protein
MNNRTARMDLVFHLAEHWTDSREPTGIGALERGGQRRWIGTHERFARMAVGEVADVPSPKILKLRPRRPVAQAAGPTPHCSGDGDRHRFQVWPNSPPATSAVTSAGRRHPSTCWCWRWWCQSWGSSRWHTTGSSARYAPIARRRCVRSPTMPTRRLPWSSALDRLARRWWLPVAPGKLAPPRRDHNRHPLNLGKSRSWLLAF